MQSRSTAVVVACVLALAADVGHAQDRGGRATLDLAPVVARIDAARRTADLPAIVRDARLDAAAQAQADDMAAHDELGHVSARTGDPATRVAATGLRVLALAENVAAERDALAAHGRLEQSDEHRANILAADATHYGLGVARGPRGAYLAELFARLPGATAVGTLGAAPPPVALAPAAPAPSAGPAATVAPVLGTPVAPRVPTPGAPAPVVGPFPVAPTTVAVNGASADGRPVIGYWVFGHGLWWYFPLPAGAQPGQALTPAPMPPGVAPPGYAPTAARVVIPAPVLQPPPPATPVRLARRARVWQRR